MGGMRAPSCRITHQFAVSVVGRHKERASCFFNGRCDLPEGFVNRLHRFDSCGQAPGMTNHIRVCEVEDDQVLLA
jgi:hypothetical protein